MLPMVRGGGRLTRKALAIWVGLLVYLSPSVVFAGDDGHGDLHEGRFKHGHLGYGTLGWAEYGVYPGLYGFSLRWHPGYGYGLYALGVGANGGYPFYGGPGYPHEPPHLNRFGPTEPFGYFGGPEYPISGWSNFYQGIGGLVVTPPVVAIGEPGDLGYVGEDGQRNPGADFGQFTGAFSLSRNAFRAVRRGSGGDWIFGRGRLPQAHVPHAGRTSSWLPGSSSGQPVSGCR